MNLSQIFILRPVATTLMVLGMVLVGGLCYGQLPISALPQIDYPIIVVSTQLPGASPETMMRIVTVPLERQLGQIPALRNMISMSGFGSSHITLQFRLERSIDVAEQDVQAAINAARNVLPPTLPSPPVYSKSNPADLPILTLALSGNRWSLPQLNDYADSILVQKLSQINGVGLVALGGGQKPAIRVQADPLALANLGLSLEDVRNMLVAANINQPKGALSDAHKTYTIATNDQVEELEDYRNLVVAYRNGSPIRLSEVAQISRSIEDKMLASYVDGVPAIVLSVLRQPGANLIGVVDKLIAKINELAPSLPAGMQLRIVGDRSQTIRASVADVKNTLLLTIVLVVLVIYLFLRSARATLIPAVVLPITLLSSFAMMQAFGFSLNNLSLMALTISTGFVVDDAIVMIENAMRFLENGQTPMQAALGGASQIGFTIVSLSLSLIAVLIPLLFMQGVLGRLFFEFAMTLTVSIVISAFLSLTLTPMMCAYWLTDHRPSNHMLLRAFEWVNLQLTQLYVRSLKWLLGYQTLVLLVLLLSMVMSVWMVVKAPKGFLPTQDTGMLVGLVVAPSDISVEGLKRQVDLLMATLQQQEGIAHTAALIGADAVNPASNTIRINVFLKDYAQRQHAAEIIRALDAQSKYFPHLQLYWQSVQDLQLDTRLGQSAYQFTIDNSNLTVLNRQASVIRKHLQTLPQLMHVGVENNQTAPQIKLKIDRDCLTNFNVSMQTVVDTLYDALGQRYVSRVYTQLNQYWVILEVAPQFAQSPQDLHHLFVNANGIDAVAIDNCAEMSLEQTPLSVSHQNQFRSRSISFDLAPQTSLGEAMTKIRAALVGEPLLENMHVHFGGILQAFEEAADSQGLLMLAAVVAVYLVLGVLYESYIHPLTILSTLPSAGMGALWALQWMQLHLDVVALIGLILLIGIVKKNAIMMIDFAITAQKEQQLSPAAAIVLACELRFRPIMMTTLAALLGGVPLALGTGMGYELRQPLGIAICGGLLFSQLLTLYTTPVVYLMFERLATWWSPRRPPPTAHPIAT